MAAAIRKPLKFYHDLMSQPARALLMFLKLNNIPFERCVVSIKAGEHLTEDYRRDINRFNKIPSIIDHDGFKLAETPAIMQYLVNSRAATVEPIADHWYPKDLKARARVDEYLSWQHMNARLHCSMYFWFKWLLPTVMGRQPSESRLKEVHQQMEKTLDTIETVWLGNGQRYIAGGDAISVADLLAACELEQTKLAEYDACEGRPNITRWMETVRRETQPHFDEAHVVIQKVIASGQAKKAKLAKL